MLETNELVENIKSAVNKLSDSELFDIAAVRAGLGVFPSNGEVVIDGHLVDASQSDAAHLRGAIGLNIQDSIDHELFDLPLNLLDELEEAIDESENQGLVETKETILKLVKMGLAVKAAETRQRILNADLAEAVSIALERLRS